eukprot:g9507.t1
MLQLCMLNFVKSNERATVISRELVAVNCYFVCRGVSGPTKNYWEVNASSKQLKPWEHAWRGVSKKVQEKKQLLWDSLGITSSEGVQNAVEMLQLATATGHPSRAAATGASGITAAFFPGRE